VPIGQLDMEADDEVVQAALSKLLLKVPVLQM
jgi:hypothetical protein